MTACFRVATRQCGSPRKGRGMTKFKYVGKTLFLTTRYVYVYKVEQIKTLCP